MTYESQSSEPLISIVIVNYNGRQLLEKCLSSLIKSDYPYFELILVDNASEDDSVDFVSKGFPSVKIERNRVNLGYAGACNKGAHIAKGDYIVFLNNDIEVTKDWIAPLINICSRPDVAICGGKIIDYNARNRLYSTGGILNLFSIPIDRGFLDVDKGQFDKLEDIAYVSGAAMMVDKKLFEIIGGFDDNFFAFCEEVDLCLRSWIYGFRVVYVPSSIVYHIFGGSFGKPSPKRRFYGVRNMFFTLVKILSLRNLFFILPTFIAFRFFEGMILTLSGRRGYIISFGNAMASAFLGFREILKERKNVQKNRIVEDSKILGFFLSFKWLGLSFKKNILKSVLQSNFTRYQQKIEI